MRPAPRHAGFTLVELLVALGASMFVLVGATLLMRSQMHAFTSTSADRNLQETGRIALEAISTDLRAAGLGVDPGLVFDFGAQTAARMAVGFPAGATFATTAWQCGANVTCRDRADGPDELVFHSRDPYFGKPLRVAASGSSTSLTVAGPLNTPLHQNQILQVLCYSGSMTWAYVQVAAEVPATALTAATVVIPITQGAGTFPTQSLANSCFSSVATAGNAASVATAAKVFKVNRFRYFIRNYNAAGGTVAWGTAGSRPWLMVDRGVIDPVSGVTLIEPVAPDVEDLQLAYTFPLDAANPVVGVTPGAALADNATSINVTGACPTYGDDMAAASRLNHHPGNIRAVQVSVVVRSTSADLSLANSATLQAIFNRPAMTVEAGYARLQLQTTVPVRNLDARAPYYPAFGLGTDQLNVGGG
jgi:type II secretory pathway pseudopilin PulG